jgi:transposase-like protein
MPSDLSNPIFNDETKAREHLESLRWAGGRFCPHCGATEGTSFVEGKKHRPGLYYCNSCKSTFTVTVGTIFERSKLPLSKWMLAYHLMAASKKGISAHQLHRMLGITYKSAWFMCHRIRESMTDSNPTPMGGSGQIVEVDETFLGAPEQEYIYENNRGWRGKRGYHSKIKVMGLVERNGRARSIKVDDLDAKTISKVLTENVDPTSRLQTDQASHYKVQGKKFAKHETVNHSKGEYARGDVTTNSVEGYFGLFKRGMTGVYQHCGEQHLQRYLNEFDFRYSNRSALGIGDTERAQLAIKGAEGKRLTYRRANGKEAAEANNPR